MSNKFTKFIASALFSFQEVCVSTYDKNPQTIVVEGDNRSLHFTFDYIHWSNTEGLMQEATQEQVRRDVVMDVVILVVVVTNLLIVTMCLMMNE